MASPDKTWWRQRFLAALEGFTDSGRLARGRAYGSDSRILKFDIADAVVTATVRGNINPYYGVYKEPRYTTRLRWRPSRPRIGARPSPIWGAAPGSSASDSSARSCCRERPSQSTDQVINRSSRSPSRSE